MSTLRKGQGYGHESDADEDLRYSREGAYRKYDEHSEFRGSNLRASLSETEKQRSGAARIVKEDTLDAVGRQRVYGQSHDPPEGVCMSSAIESHRLRAPERVLRDDPLPTRSLAPVLDGGLEVLRGGNGSGGGHGGFDMVGGRAYRGRGDRVERSSTAHPYSGRDTHVRELREPDDVTRMERRSGGTAVMKDTRMAAARRDVRFSDVLRDGDYDEEFTAVNPRMPVREEIDDVPANRPSGRRASEVVSRRSRSPSTSSRNDGPKRKPAQPDRFDGTSSVEAFLEQFETCATYNRWTEEDRYVQLKLCLKGSAAGLLKDCREDVKTYKESGNQVATKIRCERSRGIV